MDALLQRVEVLAAGGVLDHDLAVEHVAAGRELELREITLERLAAAGLDLQLLAVDEHDRAEAVVLGLICPLLASRQLGASSRQLGLDRWLQGRHRVDPILGSPRKPGQAPGYDQQMAHEQATAAEEDYLQSLFWLFEAGLPMTGANLARAMQLSAPTVHEMIGRLEREGYVERDAERTITFTAQGRDHAERIVSRHRMIERFLTDVVGVPWDDVHEEAEHLEHAMTPRFEAYVRAAVGEASTCPHGHPIKVGERIDGVPLADCALGAKVTILRLENEAEDLLHYLKQRRDRAGPAGRGRGQRRRARDRHRRRAPRHRYNERCRNRLGAGRSLTAPADRVARAARARARALRALSGWRSAAPYAGPSSA